MDVIAGTYTIFTTIALIGHILFAGEVGLKVSIISFVTFELVMALLFLGSYLICK